MFRIKLSRQQEVDDLREALRPLKESTPETTPEELAAHFQKCRDEYMKTRKKDSSPRFSAGRHLATRGETK